MGDYILRIQQIDAKKTPQSGDWRAGVSVHQGSEPDNRDSWHGGEAKFSGVDAVLPVKLVIGGLDSADQIVLFVGLDDDAEDAGGAQAEDQLNIPFKVFPTFDKEKIYDYVAGDWSLRIHYTLTK